MVDSNRDGKMAEKAANIWTLVWIVAVFLLGKAASALQITTKCLFPTSPDSD